MSVRARLRVPDPRRTLLPRPRLANPLRASNRPRLVLLSAAPGSGKTTLLRQWLAELAAFTNPSEPSPPSGRQRLRVAWVGLDQSDADGVQFVADIVDSLHAVEPEIGIGAQALLATGRANPDDVVVSLLDDLDNADGLTVLALDDLHRTADNPAAIGVLDLLLENLPPGVVVAATSRADPDLPLARLRARGELVEVRGPELRFTDAEADEFLRTVLGLDLPPAHVEALVAKTEGWAVGLQLAGVSALARAHDGPESLDAFVRAFSGTHRFVLDYLVEEVLDAQPPDDRAFLLATSVLDRLTGALADAVTGLPHGQRRLDRLERANVFLSASDDEGWYRYHPLFADALRGRLALELPDAAPQLHRVASAWFADHGQLDDALQHAASAEDGPWFADLMECAAPILRRERRDRRLIAWLAELPDAEVRRRPLLAMTAAAAKISQGDLAAAQAWLDLAEAPADAPALSQQIPANLAATRDDALRAVPANVQLFRASLAQASGDLPATVAHAKRALATAAPADHFVRGAAAGFLGLAHWAAGALTEGIDVFTGAVDHLAAAGNHTDAAGATVVLGAMALADGRPADAERLYRAALERATSTPSTATAVLADLHVGLADVLRQRNALDAAASHLEQAAQLGEAASLPENRFRWFAVRAGVQVALGQHDAALRDLDEAERRYRPGFFPDTRPLHAARARVLVWSGNLSDARAWARRHGVPDADPAAFLREDEVLTHARLVAAERRVGLADDAAVAKVLAQIAGIIEAAIRAGRQGSLIEARMVQALVLQALGKSTEATDALADAVELGVPAGYARLFLDEGTPLQPLLGRLASTGHTPTALAARTLLQTDPRHQPLPIAGPGGALSERELEVLRLLASDLSGPEIAARLFVSINTLRSHSKSIFTKLDVRTRRAAVTRAREGGLL